jgi:hypothetical protein
MVCASIFYGLIFMGSLGQACKIKSKLIEKIAIITWLSLGKPKHWGLPDKEPSLN